MELTFARQSAAFLWSVPLGAALGVLYGLFRLLRFALRPGKATVFVLDVLFMLAWALAAFYFSLAFLSGYIRLYVFAGSLLGFALYRLTLGWALCRVYQPIVRSMAKLSQKICKKSKIFAAYLLKTARRLLYNISSGLDCFKRRKCSKIRSEASSDPKKRKFHVQKKVKRKPGAVRAGSRSDTQKRSQSR